MCFGQMIALLTSITINVISQKSLISPKGRSAKMATLKRIGSRRNRRKESAD